MSGTSLFRPTSWTICCTLGDRGVCPRLRLLRLRIGGNGTSLRRDPALGLAPPASAPSVRPSASVVILLSLPLSLSYNKARSFGLQCTVVGSAHADERGGLAWDFGEDRF